MNADVAGAIFLIACAAAYAAARLIRQARVTGRWMWTKPHYAQRAIRDKACWTTGGVDLMEHEVSEVRPLVVIDPEDAGQVVRLADAFCHARWSHDECDPLTRSSMLAALREFAAPTPPKPAEPTGLGAVVEDDRGRRFVRDWTAMSKWREDGSDNEWAYRDIEAVRVLSEGVTP